MTDEPIPGGLTRDELDTFIEWNRSMGHDADDVRRNWIGYVRRWRAGGGKMPPPQSERVRVSDRYEELD